MPKPLGNYVLKNHVMDELLDLILEKNHTYEIWWPGNPIVTVQINQTKIPNTLVDIGVTINIMTRKTLDLLGLTYLRLAPTILELVNRSIVKPKGILEEVIISIDSSEYPVNLLVLNT